MKRILHLLPLIGIMVQPLAFARGQATDAAALQAERQRLEENYKALSASVQALQESHAALQKKLETALAELNELRTKTGKPLTNVATLDDLKRLAETILEVDKQRQADNKLVLEKISELGKTLAKAPVPIPPATTRKTNEASAKPDKGYEYTVISGDTLGKIIKAYRDSGIKVVQKDIENANPGVNWNRLQIGQKIWIPAPK